MEKEKEFNEVTKPLHYNQYPVDVRTIIRWIAPKYPIAEMVHPIGNAVKYICRAPFKGTLKKDLNKAIFELYYAIDIYEGKFKGDKNERD